MPNLLTRPIQRANKNRSKLILNPAYLPQQTPVATELFTCNHDEVLVSGPVDCSKTAWILIFDMSMHMEYPGFRSLIVRPEKASLYSSIVPQLFQEILALDPESPYQPFYIYGGVHHPEKLIWHNGGETVFSGMDKSGKQRGTAYDLIYYSQAEQETRESAWMDLVGRMVEGRASHWERVPGRYHSMLIGDANPDAPSHWLLQRVERGQMHQIDFRHKDNPRFYRNGEWQEEGLRTVASLKKKYKGYMLDRMVFGEWVAASGLVYPLFDAKTQVKLYARSDFPDSDWDWCCAVDYGWNDPNVCDLWALRKDREKAVLFKEIYQTEMTVGAFGKMIHDMYNQYEIPEVLWTVTDHKPDYNDELGKMGIPCVNAEKSVLRNINLVREAFAEQKLSFNSDLLYHAPDMNLSDQSRPTHFLEEIVRYRHQDPESQKSDGTADYPLASCADHSMNAMEYFAQRVWGDVPRPYVEPMVA